MYLLKRIQLNLNKSNIICSRSRSLKNFVKKNLQGQKNGQVPHKNIGETKFPSIVVNFTNLNLMTSDLKDQG